MEHVKTSDIEVVQEWRAKFPDRIAGKPEKEGEMDLSEVTNTVPEFTLFSGNRSFGGGNGKVSTVCLNIQCATEDANYLKALLARASETKRMEGLFVPAGIHLIESPAVYIGLLRSQNQYLNSTTCVPIFGMHAQALFDIVPGSDGDTGTLGEHLDKHAKFIESAQRTNKTDTEGKWFLMCKKKDVEKVHQMIDGPLREIFEKHFPEEDKFPDYPYPRRVTNQAAAPKATTTVGTYAQVLRSYGNPQDDESETVNTQYDSAPARPRKRQAVQIVFDDENFPAANNKQNQANPITQASTQETNTTSLVTSPTNYDTKIDEMNDRIQKQIHAMQLNQNAKFHEMHTKQEENMKKIQSEQETKMQDLFQKFQASLNLAVSQLVESVTGNNTAPPPSPGTGSPSISSITNQVENSSVVGAQN